MKRKRSRVLVYLGLMAVILLMPLVPGMSSAVTTGKRSEKDTQNVVKEATYSENTADIVALGMESRKITNIYDGLAVGISEDYLEVYSQPTQESEVAGRLFTDNIAEVVEQGPVWTQIISGELEGYVNTAYLCFGEEAQVIGGDMTATVMSDRAFVYETPANVGLICTLDNGEELQAVGRCGDYMIVSTEDGDGYVIEADMALNYNLAFGKTSEQIAEEEAAAAEAARRADEAKAAKIAAAMQEIDISYNPVMSVSDQEVWMLACVIDWESAWESYEGKLAVANVVLNRVRSSRYPGSIASVIYARSQFSGVSDGAGGPSAAFQARLNAGPRNQECLMAAMDALSGTNNVGEYTAFRPSYSVALETLSSFTIIGSHVFY